MRRLNLEFCGIVLAGIMALALPCIATARDSSTAGKTGTITGKVVDANGNPVGGAVVRVMRVPKGVNLPSGGGPGGGPGGPGGGPGGPPGFGGPPPGGPNGHGPHGHLKVKPGQSVWIKHTMVMGVTKTQADGTFVLKNAPVGRYGVVAMKRHKGFGHVNKPVVVKSGGTADAGTITLKKPRHGPNGPGGPGGPNGPGGPPPGQ